MPSKKSPVVPLVDFRELNTEAQTRLARAVADWREDAMLYDLCALASTPEEKALLDDYSAAYLTLDALRAYHREAASELENARRLHNRYQAEMDSLIAAFSLLVGTEAHTRLSVRYQPHIRRLRVLIAEHHERADLLATRTTDLHLLAQELEVRLALEHAFEEVPR